MMSLEEMFIAVEKQIPMPVKKIERWRLCPRCFEEYGFSYDILVGMCGLKTGKCYCRNCGQLIDMKDGEQDGSVNRGN